jgi:hypothetical protein
MCIIVDANCAHELSNRTLDGEPVVRWLLDRRRRSGLILGGKLAKELDKAGFRATLVELSRAGRLHRVLESSLRRHEQELLEEASCQSDDVHVVALTLMTGCTLVFTKDRQLHQDLRKHSRTGRRIAIYQRASHAKLLTSCDCI